MRCCWRTQGRFIRLQSVSGHSPAAWSFYRLQRSINVRRWGIIPQKVRPQNHQAVSLSSRASWSNLHPWLRDNQRLRDNQQLRDFLKYSCTLITLPCLYPATYKGCIFGPAVLTSTISCANDLCSLVSQPAKKTLPAFCFNVATR